MSWSDSKMVLSERHRCLINGDVLYTPDLVPLSICMRVRAVRVCIMGVAAELSTCNSTNCYIHCRDRFCFDFSVHTCMLLLHIQVNKKFFKLQRGYRDGVKRKGDKIEMDCTHGAVGGVTQHHKPENQQNKPYIVTQSDTV